MRRRDVLFTGLLIALGSALITWGGSAIARALSPDWNHEEWNSIPVVQFAVGIIVMSQAPAFAMRSRIRDLERRVAELAASGSVA